MNYLILYVQTIIVMGVLDAVWLSTMTKKFYAPRLGHLMGEVQWLPAVIFYLLYAMGVVYLVLVPATQYGWSLGRTVFTGAILGLICYATYDLTNQATLKNWPVAVTVVDMVWGAVLTGLVVAAVFFVNNR